MFVSMEMISQMKVAELAMKMTVNIRYSMISLMVLFQRILGSIRKSLGNLWIDLLRSAKVFEKLPWGWSDSW